MNIALLTAAGSGTRMGQDIPKQFMNIDDCPVIIYTMQAFQNHPQIDAIAVVCLEGWEMVLKAYASQYGITKLKWIFPGGDSGFQSIRNGLLGLREKGVGDDEIVIIHDGVRPMVSVATIRENIRVAQQYGGAITVHPVTESVVITEAEEAEMQNFKKRSNTYSLTAPQSFQCELLIGAYQKQNMIESEKNMPLLDAAMVYANSGRKVHLVKEQNANVKITTPEDFYYLKAMLELEESKYIFGL